MQYYIPSNFPFYKQRRKLGTILVRIALWLGWVE